MWLIRLSVKADETIGGPLPVACSNNETSAEGDERSSVRSGESIWDRNGHALVVADPRSLQWLSFFLGLPWSLGLSVICTCSLWLFLACILSLFLPSPSPFSSSWLTPPSLPDCI